MMPSFWWRMKERTAVVQRWNAIVLGFATDAVAMWFMQFASTLSAIFLYQYLGHLANYIEVGLQAL